MISPRSSNYERLESGHGPSRTGGMRRFGWKKFAIGAVVIIGLVWVFGPRKADIIPEKYIPSIPKLQLPPFGHFEDDPVETPTGDAAQKPPPSIDPPHEDNDVRPPADVRPNSPATDPDPSGTVYCKTPFKADIPIVQYALMIDAGSTGSRIHIYKFNNCGASPEYEYEVFKQIHPGLSKFEGKPLEAAQSLDILLDEAIKVVPSALQTCTPVAVKATAGLRLLGATESQEILDAVKHRLEEKYPFSLPAKDPVVIMDGSDEGVYAWITANYLLNTIRSTTPANTPTYAVLDLGGASTQIVFKPVFDSQKPESTLEEGEHKYDLTFGGKTHVLYQHSYLGYGLMRARQSVHRLVDFMSSFQKAAKDGTVANPCLAKGTQRLVTIADERTEVEKNVTMSGTDVGSFQACDRVVQLVMAKDAVCEMKPCSFNGVYQPSLLDTFPNGKVLLLSYFYDRLYPLLQPISPDEPITVSTIATLATDICEGKSSWTKLWGKDNDLMKELDERPEWCLDMTFMHALLRLGYEFGDKREVEIGKRIDGTELGWCLGATIALVGGKLKCRV
ncbi:nucleoside phosphatase family-domain-containing protein [Irpex rosettiformis]|uniref:Nucleoside phosphatase family-domain-containing protein n=1 Tax=Irpex rosettiformis TaxID=378272 RepID=A0ACB8TYG4_9APHY|nr:nucleoside phosphatase family-domain-containing protein [Irpex rosettiformis]